MEQSGRWATAIKPVRWSPGAAMAEPRAATAGDHTLRPRAPRAKQPQREARHEGGDPDAAARGEPAEQRGPSTAKIK